MTPEVPTITLNDGTTIPQLGFGVFQIPEAVVEDAVTTAFEAGYRSIDTAAGYQNEAGVGRAVAAAGLPREELYITTKLANGDHGPDTARAAFDESFAKLGLDYIDLYLIHWPLPSKGVYVETWKVLETLLEDGRLRSIGVSNFQPHHLRRLLDQTDVVPVLNQIELHPELQQQELRAFDAEHGIATEAWSPIAQGRVLGDEVITSLAAKYDKTPAQVVLRWHVQLGNVVIPKSVTPSRIRENIDLFDFELAEDDMTTIGELDAGRRTGPDPDTFGG